MSNLNTIITSDSRGQRVVLTEAESQDDAQANGNWISSDTLVEVQP